MKVKAKLDGEILHPQPNGSTWGVRFKAGEKLSIPEQYFQDALFINLEPKPKAKKGEEK